MTQYESAEQRIKRAQESIFNHINKDAEERYNAGRPEHPFTHSQALLNIASDLIRVPVEDGIRLGDEAGVKDIFLKAEAFKHSMLQVSSLASATQDVATISVVIGLLDAAKELLSGFHGELTDLLNKELEQGVTPSEGSQLDTILKGIMSNE